MKNKIYNIIWGLSVILCITSCKGFLDLEPNNSIPSSGSIGNVAEAQTAMTGTYRAMVSSSYYGRDMFLYGDLKGGDMGLVSTAIGGDELFFFSHLATSGLYRNSFWNRISIVTLQVNNILERINSGNVFVENATDQKKLDHIKGQALAVRALCLFDFTRLYGYPYQKDAGAGLGAPIVTKVLEAKAQPTRSTVAECYAQVITDLKDAILLLKPEKVNGQINKYAAEAILARVYLYKGDYENAYIQAKDVIESGGYIPYTTENWVKSWKVQHGTESIFELYMVPSESDLGLSSLGSYFAPRMQKPRNDLGSVMISDVFFTMFNGYPNDVRANLFALDEFGIKNTIPNRKGWLQKYEGDGKSSTYATNNKVIRLSEVLLIGAEAALLKTNPDITNAVAWVNKVRQRDPSLSDLTTAASKQEVLAEIERQRRIELMGEGHRYFDILRKGGIVTFIDGNKYPFVPAGGRGTTVDWNYNRCVLPISVDEINANPALKDQQNQGY